MERLSFPEHLRGRSFRRRQARLAGVYDAELLRRTDLLRPAHGVWTTEETESTVGRCRAILPLLPEGSAYSHVTAGELHALPLPSRLLAQTELDVMTRTEEAQRRRVGWNGHRGAESREILDLDGLPVTGLVDTWCDLAENAVGRRARMGTDDLVVLGDEVLNRLILDALKEMDPWEQPTGRWHLDGDLVATTLAQLDAVIAARVRPRGKRAMTAARALLRAGVRSPQESRHGWCSRTRASPIPASTSRFSTTRAAGSGRETSSGGSSASSSSTRASTTPTGLNGARTRHARPPSATLA